jgi:TM2 domain-containing membrane protein YozV
MTGDHADMPAAATATDDNRTPPMRPTPVPELPPEVARKRVTAGMCGILFGWLGIHKFVMGWTGPGLIMLGISIVICTVGSVAMWVIGILEGITYLRQTDEEFYRTYIVGDRRWF